MLEFAIKKWDKNKDRLQQYFVSNKQEKYAENYAQFAKTVIAIIFNDGDYGYENNEQQSAFDTKNFFKVVDFGDY